MRSLCLLTNRPVVSGSLKFIIIQAAPSLFCNMIMFSFHNTDEFLAPRCRISCQGHDCSRSCDADTVLSQQYYTDGLRRSHKTSTGSLAFDLLRRSLTSTRGFRYSVTSGRGRDQIHTNKRTCDYTGCGPLTASHRGHHSVLGLSPSAVCTRQKPSGANCSMPNIIPMRRIRATTSASPRVR